MALGAEVVDFVGLQREHEIGKTGAVGQIAVMQKKPGAGLVWILVKVLDAFSVERAGPADETMHLVTLG